VINVATRNEREIFRDAVNEAWEKYNLGSVREAACKLDMSTTVLQDMRKYGRRPSLATLTKWAEGIGEPIERWKDLAGFVQPKLTKNEVLIQLRSAGNLSEEAVREIADIIEREEQRERKERGLD
jgi:hypothetical protein